MHLTLYHYWRSSCSWRVRWALALKGIKYDAVPVNILTGEHKAPAYLAISPSGFLPALKVDGQVFAESLAIIDWLEEAWPTPALLPPSPFDRMRVRQLALQIASGTQPLQNPSLLKYYEPTDEAARRRHSQHWILRGLTTYEELLNSQKRSGSGAGAYSFGDSVTLADLCLVPQVYNALRFEVDLSSLPLIRGIYARCRETPACQQAAPENQVGAS